MRPGSPAGMRQRFAQATDHRMVLGHHHQPVLLSHGVDDRCFVQRLDGGAVQHRHVTPAKIEPLTAHRVAAVARLAHQHGGAPVQVAGQQQAHRKGTRIVHEGIGLESIRQGPGKGIEEGRIPQALELAAAVGGGAPDQLEQALPQGQNGKGALRTEQLPGLVVGRAAQLHQGREAVLAVGPLHRPDAQGRPGGGVGPIGSHDQIGRSHALGGQGRRR